MTGGYSIIRYHSDIGGHLFRQTLLMNAQMEAKRIRIWTVETQATNNASECLLVKEQEIQFFPVCADDEFIAVDG